MELYIITINKMAKEKQAISDKRRKRSRGGGVDGDGAETGPRFKSRPLRRTSARVSLLKGDTGSTLFCSASFEMRGPRSVLGDTDLSTACLGISWYSCFYSSIRTFKIFHRVIILLFSYQIWLVEVLLYVHRNRSFIRDESPGRPPRLSHSS